MPPVLSAPSLSLAEPGKRSWLFTPSMRLASSRKAAREFCYTGRSPLILGVIIVGHVFLLAGLTSPATPLADAPPKTLAVRLIVPVTQAPKPPRLKAAPIPKPPRQPKKPASMIASTAASSTSTLSPSATIVAPATEAALAESVTESEQIVSPPTSTPPVEVEPLPVVPPRFNADYLDNPKPPYPVLSHRLKEEGEVRLRVWVDAAGAPSRVALSKSSGFERLDRIALETVQRWRFTPARQGDQAIAAQVIVPITFNLKD